MSLSDYPSIRRTLVEETFEGSKLKDPSQELLKKENFVRYYHGLVIGLG